MPETGNITTEPSAVNNYKQVGNFTVFPNPTFDFITIQAGENKNWSYELYNITGKKVLSGKVVGLRQKIDISALAKGSYQLKVNAGTESYADKVVKL